MFFIQNFRLYSYRQVLVALVLLIQILIADRMQKCHPPKLFLIDIRTIFQISGKHIVVQIVLYKLSFLPCRGLLLNSSFQGLLPLEILLNRLFYKRHLFRGALAQIFFHIFLELFGFHLHLVQYIFLLSPDALGKVEVLLECFGMVHDPEMRFFNPQHKINLLIELPFGEHFAAFKFVLVDPLTAYGTVIRLFGLNQPSLTLLKMHRNARPAVDMPTRCDLCCHHFVLSVATNWTDYGRAACDCEQHLLYESPLAGVHPVKMLQSLSAHLAGVDDEPELTPEVEFALE